MPVNRKASGKLEKLQQFLDAGRTPGECARFFQQEYGWLVKSSAIRHAIRRHGLRFTPKPVPKPPKSEKQLKRLMATAEPAEPVMLDLDYSHHDEDPGDARDEPYSWRSTAESMRRQGEY